MKIQFDNDELDKMRSDPENYKWGIFYFNVKDVETVVPKRNKWMGFTLNFASPYSYLIILSILFFSILMGRLEK